MSFSHCVPAISAALHRWQTHTAFPTCVSLLQLVWLKAKTPVLLYLYLTNTPPPLSLGPSLCLCEGCRCCAFKALFFYTHTHTHIGRLGPLHPKALILCHSPFPCCHGPCRLSPKWPCLRGPQGAPKPAERQLSLSPFCIPHTPFTRCLYTSLSIIGTPLVHSSHLNSYSTLSAPSVNLWSCCPLSSTFRIVLFLLFKYLLVRGHISNVNADPQLWWVIKMSPWTHP